jgi:hypothetical protein
MKWYVLSCDAAMQHSLLIQHYIVNSRSTFSFSVTRVTYCITSLRPNVAPFKVVSCTIHRGKSRGSTGTLSEWQQQKSKAKQTHADSKFCRKLKILASAFCKLRRFFCCVECVETLRTDSKRVHLSGKGKGTLFKSVCGFVCSYVGLVEANFHRTPPVFGFLSIFPTL